jgi:phytoene dehydrogenase-like protein
VNERWDAIVVGAGQGGLTCAAYLAVAGGMRVLVLERNAVAGGSAQVFRRRGRYEFDVGTHYIADCGPDGLVRRMYSALGLDDRISFRQLDPDRIDRIVLPSVTVDMPLGWAAYRERLVAALPAEADGIRRFVDTCARVHASTRDAVLGGTALGVPPAGPVAPQRGVGGATLGQLMRDCGLSAQARTVLAAQAGNYGLGPEAVSAKAHATMLGDYLLGAYYPAGGGQMMAATLVEALEAYGGELRTRTEVAEVVVRDGRAAGVGTTAGELLDAPVVVSNGDYRQTMLRLVAADHLPAAAVSRARRATMALPWVTLYLAVEPGALQAPVHNVWWYETEDIDGLFAELDRGEFAVPRFAFISSGSAKAGPPRTPAREPHHTLEVMTLCPPRYPPWSGAGTDPAGYGYRNDPGYLAEKERLDAALLELATRAVGPLRGRLLHRELATPLTHTRFTLSTGGTPYGLAATPRQFDALRPDHRTALPGLYLVGSSSRSGHGIAAVMTGGLRCAGLILDRPLVTEVYRGAVYGSPDALAPRPENWDPLDVSRGSRARRHPGRRTVPSPVVHPVPA